jgi:hypothetical protein
MVTILLQQILDLLKGFFGDFVEWCNTMGDHIAAIHTNTDSLPDIKTNTDSIADDTTPIKNAVQNLNTWAAQIYNRVNGIEQKTDIIKNNSASIAASSGTAAAFAEDCATNTLNINNRLVTIGSDTTQIRADSTSLAADVAEIKDTLGLYLYNTIVTEDAEGSIANFDTDIKDYLQNAVVTIPAEAGGISGITIINCRENLWNEDWEVGTYNTNTGAKSSNTSRIRSTNKIKIQPGSLLYFSQIGSGVGISFCFYDESGSFIQGFNRNSTIYGFSYQTLSNYYYVTISPYDVYGNTYNNDISLSLNSSTYSVYEGNSNSITFGSSITDGAEVDLLSGIVKINTSPVTYDSITPIAIRTYKGINNFYSDIGTTAVTYRETLKHYLKKQEA